MSLLEPEITRLTTPVTPANPEKPPTKRKINPTIKVAQVAQIASSTNETNSQSSTNKQAKRKPKSATQATPDTKTPTPNTKITNKRRKTQTKYESEEDKEDKEDHEPNPSTLYVNHNRTVESSHEACTVCCETYNQTKRKRVICGHCKYSACRQCCQRYFLNNLAPAQCMNCHQVWGYIFLYDNFTQVFVNEQYTQYRGQMLLDHEKAFLQEAMELARHEQHYNQTGQNVEKTFRQRIGTLVNVPRGTINPITELAHLIQNHHQPGASTEADAKVVQQYMMPCDQPNCRGLVNQDGQCQLCHASYCPQCQVYLADKPKLQHECNPETLASIKFMKSTSTQCPKCLAFVHRIHGCSQMWCTQCRTPFDYKTGKIVLGQVHNPHYFQYLYEQKTDRQFVPPLTGPCDMPFMSDIRPHLLQIDFPIVPFYSRYVHLQNQIVDYWVQARDSISVIQCPIYYRVLYLTGSLSESQWRKDLSRHDAEPILAHEILGIYRTWMTTFMGQCRELMQKPTLIEKLSVVRGILHHTNMANRSIHRLKLIFPHKDSHMEYVVADIWSDQDHRDITKLLLQDIKTYLDPRQHRNKPPVHLADIMQTLHQNLTQLIFDEPFAVED
jgi:hypothetical protein